MPDTALATDLYQLTMMAGYFATGRHHSTTATFELFARRLPPHRRFLIAAGLGPLLDFLETLRFDDPDIAFLKREAALAALPSGFFDYLREFRFTADVFAIPEGTPVFANEPLLRVTGLLPEGQLIETAALAFLNFQTSVASKAARVVLAAANRPVIEFGARRAHGLEAALFAARAAYLAGCAGTSFVEAGARFGIPLSGTMAHSWVLSAADERSAFQSYEALFGTKSVLLLDTYDTLAAARAVVASNLRPAAVRLDSGDLASLSGDVRAILDAANLRQTRILASSDLDEYRIAALLAAGAPIDAFGVGTSISTSIDAPALGGVYKLVEVVERGQVRGVMKKSEQKETWPGRKQVWRVMDGAVAVRDVVAFEGEPPPPSSMPLLQPVMRRGQRVVPYPTLTDSREWCRMKFAELPEPLRRIDGDWNYPVLPSERLAQAIDRERGSA